MKRIFVSEELAAKLKTVIEPVELCDMYGRVLGRFEPTWHLPQSSKSFPGNQKIRPGGEEGEKH